MALASLPSRSASALVLLVALLGGAPRGADGAAVTGTVVAPDGKPVDGAEVIVATAHRPAWPNVPAEKRAPHQASAATARTDREGRFTVDVPDGATLLCVQHEKGYAEVRPESLAKSPRVELERWCVLEGVVKLGAKPAGNVQVDLHNFPWRANAGRAHYGYAVTSDAKGRYKFDRVPAGVAGVTVRPGAGSSPVTLYTFVKPDEPGRLDVGGSGATVTGKVVPGGGYTLKDLNSTKPDTLFLYSHFNLAGPYPEPPRTPEGASQQDQEDAHRKWRLTPDAETQFTRQHRYEIALDGDGSFRLDDVPPGKYSLAIVLTRVDPDTRQFVEFGSLSRTVEVPDSPAPHRIDLGDLSIGSEGL